MIDVADFALAGLMMWCVDTVGATDDLPRVPGQRDECAGALLRPGLLDQGRRGLLLCAAVLRQRKSGDDDDNGGSGWLRRDG